MHQHLCCICHCISYEDPCLVQFLHSGMSLIAPKQHYDEDNMDPKATYSRHLGTEVGPQVAINTLTRHHLARWHQETSGCGELYKANQLTGQVFDCQDAPANRFAWRIWERHMGMRCDAGSETMTLLLLLLLLPMPMVWNEDLFSYLRYLCKVYAIQHLVSSRLSGMLGSGQQRQDAWLPVTLLHLPR